MNQIFDFRFIIFERHCPTSLRSLSLTLFSILVLLVNSSTSHACPQNNYQDGSRVSDASYQGDWAPPRSGSLNQNNYQASRIPTEINSQMLAPQPTSTWPEQTVSFDSQLEIPALDENTMPGGTRSLEDVVDSAGKTLSGWKDKASEAFSALKGGEATGGGLNIQKMLSSLALVLGAYFGFVWFARKFSPKSNQQLPGEVVEVLGRTGFGPKQNLQLIRLGSKLVLLLNGPEGTHPIGEITDPNEVNYLISVCDGNPTQHNPMQRNLPQPGLSGSSASNPQSTPSVIFNQGSGAGTIPATNGDSATNQGLASVLRSLENVVRNGNGSANGGNVFEA